MKRGCVLEDARDRQDNRVFEGPPDEEQSVSAALCVLAHRNRRGWTACHRRQRCRRRARRHNDHIDVAKCLFELSSNSRA